MKIATVATIILIGSLVGGCAKDYHLQVEKRKALHNEVPKSMGMSFSNLLQKTGTEVSIVLPLRYPDWPKEKLEKELKAHAKKYGGNIMYVEQDGNIVLRSPDADQKNYWINYSLNRPQHNSFFHWEPNISTEFTLDGDITANYILEKKAFDLSGYSADYYVILVKNDKIVGYIWPYPAQAGEIEYVNKNFGFFIF